MRIFSFISNGKRYKVSILSFIFPILTLLILYIFFQSIPLSSNRQPNNENDSVKIQNIEKPRYEIPKITFDKELKKFPDDYDYLITTLQISLTQHQKMSLLLYGETESKTTHTSIKNAYEQLIEKEIPILIPSQYIQTYIDTKLDEYISQLSVAPIQLRNVMSKEPPVFENPFQRYLWLEMRNMEYAQDSTEISGDLSILNFNLEISSEQLNDAIYKVRILRSVSKDIDISSLQDFLNDLLIYSQNRNDVNAGGRLLEIIPNMISNTAEYEQGEIYWKISVIDGTSLLYPVALSKDFPVDDNNFNIDYDVTPIAQTKDSVRVPILMYHQIKPAPSGSSDFVAGLYVSPESFEEQLAYLVKKNYKSLTSQEFYTLLSEGENPKQKSVMITLDDGSASQYAKAFPLLQKYGLVGIYYIPSNKTAITYDQLRIMAKAGMIIESHSATHINLAKENNPKKLNSEIAGSRNSLRSATGQDVITICYPGCVADREAFSHASQAGYLLGVSCGKSIDHYFSKRLSLSRVHVFDSLSNFKSILSGMH